MVLLSGLASPPRLVTIAPNLERDISGVSSRCISRTDGKKGEEQGTGAASPNLLRGPTYGY